MLSVIVPVFDVEKYLKQAITCLLSQDIEDMEIILIDDGSTDKSAEICDYFAKKYDNIVVLHQDNLGVSNARNNGLKNAKGKYIAFLDPDDFIDENYYKELICTLESKNADIVFSRYKRYYEDSKKVVNVDEAKLEALANNPDDIFPFFENAKPDSNDDDTLMGYIWRSIFKKEIIDNNNIEFDEDIAFSEDLLFLLNYLQYAKSICISDSYGYNYRIRSSSATAVSYKQDLYKTRKSCVAGFTKIINSNPFMTKEDKATLLCRLQYAAAKEIIYNEMRFNSNALKQLKEYFNDGFADLFLCSSALKQAKADNIDKINYLVLFLAKNKLLLPIKLMYSLKYKK